MHRRDLLEIEHFLAEHMVDGIEMLEERVRLTRSAPELALGGWVFVARLVREEAGYITYTAPDQNLDGVGLVRRPRTATTAGTRERSNLFVVRRSETGRDQAGRIWLH